MTQRPRLTREQVKHLAAYAGITLSAGRLESLAGGLQAMHDANAALSALPLDGLEPATIFRVDPLR